MKIQGSACQPITIVVIGVAVVIGVVVVIGIVAVVIGVVAKAIAYYGIPRTSSSSYCLYFCSSLVHCLLKSHNPFQAASYLKWCDRSRLLLSVFEVFQ